MAINLIEYYKALNGESSLNRGEWNVNYDKRHSFSIYSDFDALDGSNDKIILPPSVSEIDVVSKFSNTINQKFVNTKIVVQDENTEEIHLDLDDRIVTVVVDQSGSMTWNDSNNFRHDLSEDLVNKIDNNYPGDVKFNLLKYGSKIIDVLFFGIIKDISSLNTSDLNSLNQVLSGDENSNYAGVRVSRKENGYPTAYAGIDGEIIQDGFISRIMEDNLSEGTTYYYKIYTYDHDLKFSEGIKIKVTPRERNVPRGISIFKTFVDTNNINTGSPLLGYGVNKDNYVIGLWHMSEGKGRYVFDFSDNGVTLSNSNEFPIWYDDLLVPSGVSGLFFNGNSDCLQSEDSNNDFEMTWSSGKTDITISAWIFPYPSDETGVIFCRGYGTTLNYIFGLEPNGTLFFDNGSSIFDYSTIVVEYGKWQYVSVTCDGTSITYHINDQTEIGSIAYTPYVDANSHSIFIGSTPNGNSLFFGGMTEVSVHNTIRSSSYFLSQLVENPVYDGNGIEVETEYIGIKKDNGDRLVALEYEIPEDFNFSGGEVIIVKNEYHIPSWEEDGVIIYQEPASAGIHFVSDSSDFCLGETYYYRIFSKNSDGNVSFVSDSSYLNILIPTSETNDYFLPLDSPISEPVYPSYGQIITPGNNKIYLRWGQTSPLDDRISKVKIYYSADGYPVVNRYGQHNGTLIFTGDPSISDGKFVHRNIRNGISAYYTIVNIDKYGRPSNYNPNGSQSSDFLQIMSIPVSDADESTIPLVEVENIQYNLIDSNSVSIGWDLPIKKTEDQIESYFDQTVLLYSSIIDEYGIPVSEDTLIKMYINAEINRETQASDVFGPGETVDFSDTDAYSFFVNRTPEGIIKGVLRMTTNNKIISQIKDATFTIQLKAYVPKEGYVPPHTSSRSTNPMEEYAKAITDLANDGESSTSTQSSENIFEYYSKPITVHFINPWEITLTNLGNKKVSQRCYVENIDVISGITTLLSKDEAFNGVYMKSSYPFVARVKVLYKGKPLDSGSVQVAIWDADSSNLCGNASAENSSPYEGPAIQVSSTVFPPDNTMQIISGTEIVDGYDDPVPISYVDIPLKAPSLPQAVRLFVKGSKSGYSSVKDMYILFQSILRIELSNDAQFNNIVVDGKDIVEQYASVFIINPDYPNYTSVEYDRSLITYPEDNTVVQWTLSSVGDESKERNIYSIDNVPISNGIYSYTRNGSARNVFFGPIQKESTKIDESHEITATVVYKGLTSFAKKRIEVHYDPVKDKKLLPRFLMEIDGSWRKDSDTYVWGGPGWMVSDVYPLWSDGKHYKKVKIHRNPAIALTTDFSSATCFRNCASSKGLNVFELDSNQLVTITMEDESIEILHGEIYEDIDPYTGEPYLIVGEDGYIDNGTANITLNDKTVSDITYFYIRINKTFSSSGRLLKNEECNDQDSINDCLCLGKDSAIGLTECDLPEWEPIIYVNGETTVFANGQPLILYGGGGFDGGIPPCPICLLEPLNIFAKWRKITNYYYNEEIGDPSNNYIYSIITEVGENDFLDKNGESLIQYNSDIDIRVQVMWKDGNVPDGTPVYVAIGNDSWNTVFLASQNLYYTQTDDDDGYSYVDVRISVRRPVETTTTEVVQIYSIYDENGRTERHKGVYFNLTLEKKQASLDPPVIIITEPSVPDIVEEETPFSSSMSRYNILSNQWDILESMPEGKGNFFGGEVGGKIYTIGGLKNNSLNISNKTFEYDILLGTWNAKRSMPVGRFAGMSFTMGSDIYIIGGIFQDIEAGGSLSVCGDVDVYHSDTDTWETLSRMPVINASTGSEERTACAFGTLQHVVISLKNYLYIVGGIKKATVGINNFSINEYNKRIFRYCIEDDVWEYSDILRSNELETYQRISPLSIAYDEKLIVFGGAIEDNKSFIYPVDDFYINIEQSFETPLDGEWIKSGSGFLADFPLAKFQAALVKYDEDPSGHSIYYILGGGNKESPCLDIIEKITTDDGVFGYESSYDVNSSSSLSALQIARHGMMACFSNADGNPCIYIIGGYTFAIGNTIVDMSFSV